MIILGEGGALDFILAKFQKVDLKPNLKKFQAYTTSPAKFQAALSAEQKRWLKRRFIITDPINRSQVKRGDPGGGVEATGRKSSLGRRRRGALGSS